MKVFVYGTLKQQYHNNRILRNKDYIGDFVISGYKLTEHNRGGIPFAIPADKEKIKGEVWDIHDDRDCLNSLDRLEGHPHFYVRTPATTDDGQEVEFYVLHENSHWRKDLVDCPKNENNQYYWEA